MPTPAAVPITVVSLVLTLSLLRAGVSAGGRAATTGADQPGNILASAGVVPGSDTAPATAPTLTATLGTTRVRDVNGKVVPLVPPGQPGVLMISSTSCTWCKRTLKDLGEMSNASASALASTPAGSAPAPRAVPRFTVLALEGASEGVPMLAKEHLIGARLVGPATEQDEMRLTFRFPGTPTLIAVDRHGRVTRVIPGYPIRDELQRLWRVMAGESTAP